MNRIDLVRQITKHTELTNVKAEEALNAVLFEIKNALSLGEALTIRGFGTLKTIRKAERQGRNPQTGEPHVIRKRRVVVFKASPYLKDVVDMAGYQREQERKRRIEREKYEQEQRAKAEGVCQPPIRKWRCSK